MTRVRLRRSRSAPVSTDAPPTRPAATPPRAPARPTFTVEKLVAGGLGLARDEAGVVLIEGGVLPGEVVTADVQAARGVRRGVLAEVLSASPDRVPDPVRLPTADLAHATLPAQLRFKRDVVREALTRIAKLDADVHDTVPSPREWAYRSTVQYLVRGERLAYRARHTNDAVPVTRDPLAHEAITKLLGRLDVWALDPAREIVLRGSALTGEVLVALVGEHEPRAYRRAVDTLLEAGATGVSLAPPATRRFTRGAKLLSGEPTILERYGRLDLSVSATGFAQINPEAASALYLAAEGLASGDLAGGAVAGHVLDLYGGAGGLGLHVASRADRVTVLDASPEALARGAADARRLGITNVTFREGDASLAPDADVVIVDPPRIGLDDATRYAVHASGASRLVYVSCDPATWARDVADFVGRGWTLGTVTPYDFYPQTSHVEVLSVLTR